MVYAMPIEDEKFICLIDEYKKTKTMSEELGKLFLAMASRLTYYKNFIYYTNDWKDGMVSDALYNCCRYADRYNIIKGDNPQGYFSRAIKRSFINFIKKEQKDTRMIEILKDNAMKNYLDYFQIQRNDYEWF